MRDRQPIQPTREQLQELFMAQQIQRIESQRLVTEKDLMKLEQRFSTKMSNPVFRQSLAIAWKYGQTEHSNG